MSETGKTWMEGWYADPQAFFKAMFPAATGDGTPDAQMPLDEHFRGLRDTWTASIEQWSKLAVDGGQTPSLTPDALASLFAPARWSNAGGGTFDSVLRHVIEGPKYAMLWDLDRKLAQLQHQATRRDKAVAAYTTIVQRAWSQAFARFSTNLGKDENPPVTWRDLLDRWLAVANQSLIEVHRSEEFIEAQREMLRCASDYRLQEREIAEAWCDAHHIPTRTEMDEMQRVVTELRRQLRSQERSSTPPARKTPRTRNAQRS